MGSKVGPDEGEGRSGRSGRGRVDEDEGPDSVDGIVVGVGVGVVPHSVLSRTVATPPRTSVAMVERSIKRELCAFSRRAASLRACSIRSNFASRNFISAGCAAVICWSRGALAFNIVATECSRKAWNAVEEKTGWLKR